MVALCKTEFIKEQWQDLEGTRHVCLHSPVLYLIVNTSSATRGNSLPQMVVIHR